MTITLTYNTDLARVRMDLSGLAADEPVLVQRSLNGTLWDDTVRGGVALPVLSGAAFLHDYEFEAGHENFYRVKLASSPEDPPLEQASITPVLTQVWLKSILWPFLNRVVQVVNWSDVSRGDRGAVHPVAGRSVPLATSQVRGSQQFDLTIISHCTQDRMVLRCAGGEPLATVRDLDFVLAAGDTMFLHTPAGSRVPGGYVHIGDTTQARVADENPDTSYLFTLPCTVVAAPGPDVVGTTMTWGGVRRLYGSWVQIAATNPTWVPLLETVGDPEDLVVL